MDQIEMFQRLWPKSRFSKTFDKNLDFHKFPPQSRIFDNFYQNQVFSTILTKFQIFRQFSPKSIFPNQHFSIILTKSRFSEILRKIEVFFKNLTKINIFFSFVQNRQFGKFWPKSRIFDHFGQDRDCSKILTKFEISQ